MKRKVFVSFSGGETSAYMSRRLLDENDGTTEYVFMFANTGQEHEKTLQFVDRCDKEWGLNVVWLEAVVNPSKGKGTTHKVVTFETASRNGQPFVDVCSVYGIPNTAYPHCTRELKAQPMASFVRSQAPGSQVAIGIRADEIDRISADAKKRGFIYPLIKWRIMKYDVRAYWDKMPFRLGIPEHHGNCLWCWKKSGKKHGMLLREMPEIYQFPAMLEMQYGYVNSNQQRVFFRNNTSAAQVMSGLLDGMDDAPNGCSESCEAFDF